MVGSVIKAKENREEPLTVEFTGLPGAGKSTVARRVVAELNAAGYRCLTRDVWRELRLAKPQRPPRSTKELFHFLWFCTTRTTTALHALSYSIQVSPRNRRSLQRGLTFLRKLFFIRRAVREGARGGYDIILLDQGLMQYFFSMVVPASPPPEKNLSRLLKSVLDELPRAIVSFDVDIDTAIERIKERSTMGSYFDRIPPIEAKALLNKYRSYVKKIANGAAELNGTHLLSVSGNDDIQKNAISVVRFIDQIWRARTQQTSPLKVGLGN